jgi:mxaA protein
MQIYSPIISTNMWQPELMKNLLTTLRTRTQQYAALCLALLLLSSAYSVHADEARLPEIDKKYVRLSTIEPVRDSGYTVGDLITRTVTMEVKKPYKLLDTSLPIVGYEKRYQGQVIGIELRDIKKVEEEKSDSTVYTIDLTYQIFTRNVVAKPAALPPEFVKIQGEKEVYAFRIPSWNFRISPIAVFGEVKLESDMSPFRGPLLKTDEREQLTLKIALAILVLSALGLLYILGVHAWLPRMGGPFARAYRELRKLKKLAPTDETLKLGLTAVHKAFNRSYGNSIFSDDVDAFIANKPVFVAIRPEIEKFFALSRQMFFNQTDAQPMSADQHEWLRQFTRRCRDCERGLRPEKRA